MKKAIFSKNGMKMIIDSGYKKFDKATNYISKGNVMANTQYSSYIRSYNEVKNGNYTGKLGDFLKYDLQFFKNVNPRIMNILNDKTREKSMILYQFNIGNVIIGHILTDYDHNYIASSAVYTYGVRLSKIYSCLEELENYVCN